MTNSYYLLMCSTQPVTAFNGTVSCTGSASPVPLLTITDIQPIITIIMGILAVAYTFRLLGRFLMSMSDD